MKEFSCGDVVPGCQVRFSFATTEELLHAVAEHAQHDHGLTELPQTIVDAVVANIHTVAA